MSYFVVQGAVAPECVRVRVENAPLAADPLDLAAVLSATLDVQGPAGPVSWPCTIVSQTSALLVLEHAFAIADVYLPGTYSLIVLLVMPGSVVRRAGPTVLNVI